MGCVVSLNAKIVEYTNKWLCVLFKLLCSDAEKRCKKTGIAFLDNPGFLIG